MAKHLVFWITAVSILILDRITKFLVVSNLKLGESIDYGFFSITHILNKGTAFGLLKNASWLFALLAFAVCIYIIVKYSSFPFHMQPVLALVFAGALGNLIDRLWYHAVIDMIDLHFWPVFNIADSAISVAIVWLLFLGWKRKV